MIQLYLFATVCLSAEFEASHGTVSDLWLAHLRGEETSMNPLGMVEAILGAMDHATTLDKSGGGPAVQAQMRNYISVLRRALHNTFRYGQGTRDMAGPEGLTTEAFVSKVGNRLRKYLAEQELEEAGLPREVVPDLKFRRNHNVDREALRCMFLEYDTNNSGAITIDQLEAMLVKLGVAPMKDPLKKRTASDRKSEGATN